MHRPCTERPFRRSIFIQTALTSLLFLSPFQIAVAATEELPDVVFSASRIEQPIHRIGSSVAVLSSDELRERGVEFVADALLEVPSLIVSSQGPRGSMTQVRVRGNEANHALILIDGMRVSNASTGEYDLANMNLESVEKIEVLLGPQSTLYGSDAIAGVISITTRKGREGFEGLVRAGIGSQKTRSGSAQIRGGQQGWHYSLTTSKYLTDGISAASEANGNFEKDDYQSKSLNIKAGYDQDNFQTWLVFNQTDSRYDFDSDDFVSGLAVDEESNRQWGNTRSLALVMAAPLFDGRMTNQLQLSKIENDLELYTVFFGSGSTYETKTDRNTLEYQGSFKLNEANSLQFGAERFEEELLATSYSVFNRSVEQKGAYLQWLTAVGDLDLSLGSRWDKHDTFGTQNTYRLTASYPVNDRFRLRASHSTGFKAPSLQELYDTSFGGNPELNPEESTSSELGLEYRSDDYHASLTLFTQDTDNLIRYAGVYPTGINQNVDSAESKGAELAFGLSRDEFQLDAALSRVRATETKDGITLERIRVPKWSGHLLASYYLTSGRVWAQALYRGERRDVNFSTSEDVRLKGYWLINLGASHELADNLTLSGRIENLADKQYEEIYSYGTRGRTGMLTLDWRF
jgi:vitamin B12 transporter